MCNAQLYKVGKFYDLPDGRHVIYVFDGIWHVWNKKVVETHRAASEEEAVADMFHYRDGLWNARQAANGCPFVLEF
jgi:hypothetical protein